jgi:hypothetical protein
MENNQIKNLLDKYFEGETSLEEEKILHEYFTKNNIDKDVEIFKPLFNYFSSEKNITTSKNFEAKMLAKIKEQQPVVKLFKLYWLKAAAAVLLLIGAAEMIYKLIDNNKIITTHNIAKTTNADNNLLEIKDTYNNPEDAKKAIEHVLTLISGNLNKGKNITQKNIQKINVLNKVFE